MRKLVVANRGVGQIGKSASILAVYHLLKDRGFKTILETWQYEYENGDIKAIFDINGVKVGIESQGDPNCEMEDAMEEFVAEGCEIIVTACRTKSATYEKVRDYLGAKNNYDILWCAHYVYHGVGADVVKDTLNEVYAEHVLKLIQDRIAGVL